LGIAPQPDGGTFYWWGDTIKAEMDSNLDLDENILRANVLDFGTSFVPASAKNVAPGSVYAAFTIPRNVLGASGWSFLRDGRPSGPHNLILSPPVQFNEINSMAYLAENGHVLVADKDGIWDIDLFKPGTSKPGSPRVAGEYVISRETVDGRVFLLSRARLNPPVQVMNGVSGAPSTFVTTTGLGRALHAMAITSTPDGTSVFIADSPTAGAAGHILKATS